MASSHQAIDARFYLIMAIASSCLVLLGFSRSYYLGAYFGAPPLSLLLHIHGIVFTAWMFFFITQTALIASDRPYLHRRLGYWGGVLASAMVVLGLMVAFLVDILTFAIFVGAGFLWRHNRETHQRLMLLAVVAGLLSAAVPRLPLIGGHRPRMALTGFAFLFAGPIYDLVSRRRIHQAYVWGYLFRVSDRSVRAHQACSHSRLASRRQMAG